MFTRQARRANVPAWRTGKNIKNDRLIGIEFECENPKGYNATLRALPEPPRSVPRPVTERDGSLDDFQGVEIVFPPLSHKHLKDENSYFNTAIKSIGDAGVKTTSETGMHMNVNITGWPEEKVNSFLYTLHKLPGNGLHNIGGRALNHWCSQADGLRWDTAVADSRGHTLLANVVRNRCEVRFPKSTVDIKRIALIVNFLRMVEDFSAIKATHKWLASNPNRNQVAKRFVEYLTHNRSKTPAAQSVKEAYLYGYDKPQAARARPRSAA